MLVHRLRRWPDIKKTLVKCLLLAGTSGFDFMRQKFEGVNRYCMEKDGGE